MVDIPNENEWSYKKVVIYPGSPGSWDCRLHGMITPCAMIKKNNTYFLYYIGSDGDRTYPHTDKGPRHRKLGVATSTDGLNFTKYSNNPILSYSPTGNDEEGVFSAGAILDDNGDIVIYYGAMKSPHSSSTLVNADIRVVTSHDGFRFFDDTLVVSHSNSKVWGYGDELFPFGALKHNGIWYVYYSAVGSGVRWDLGVAWGNTKTNLPNTKEFFSSSDYIKSGCNPVPLDSTKFALFIGQDDNNKEYIIIKTVNYSDPTKIVSTVKSYYMNTHFGHVVFNDGPNWFMYYRTEGLNQHLLRTARSSINIFPINFNSNPYNADVKKI